MLDVKNATYTKTGTIIADIKFGDEKDEHGQPKYYPYHAVKGDKVFNALITGKYGEIAPYTVTPDMIAYAKSRKKDEINEWRDKQENGRVIFRFDGHNWDCSKDSQERLDPVITLLETGALPDGFFWTDADNLDVPVTAEKLTALKQEMIKNLVLQGFKIHERQRQMKEEIAAMTDLDAIESYVPQWEQER